MIVFFLIVSLLASVIGAICGIGGGIIIKPVLDSLNVLEVSKISFLSSCTVLSMSLYTFVVSKIKHDSLVDSKVATPLALGGIIGGILGKMLFSYVIAFFNSENIAGIFQSAILILLTFFTLIFTLKNMGDKKIKSMHIQNIFLCVLIGLVLGLLSSFLGIGGGPFNIAFLYFFFSMDSKVAAQNSLYIILFSQISNVFISVADGDVLKVNIYYLIVMIIGGIGGGILGRFINKKINSNIVSKLFIILLIIILLITSYNLYNFSVNI
ncbi:membrane protein [Brachyspira hyodysenteriae]|uniref:Probable membrane transporter protein n=1 Tax=Brachyspira hyodysenteriae (strain ATCC 49526 / WA1) TaxID=565034 RepID=A0A3B6VG66_BRAHW|nr:TSUP family transporter [Brachyspira hyodysenteriae]ACN83298.1 transmembrane protein [Brachyspira hyodysenteriae WA1]KLI47635.1 membrane protein [Brachyspira hyodysenteriae]KLI56364.1 membrane protein [Brachyspira hyodysenteriae]